MAKKIIVTYEKMTKPALIALVKTLQKRVAKLEGASTAVNRELRGPASQELINSEDQASATVSELTPQDAAYNRAFPWDVK